MAINAAPPSATERLSWPGQAAELAPLDLFITDELDTRPANLADRDAEDLAVRALVSRIGEAPDEILPLFVKLAMELTKGSAAGLSLLESGPGVFRWTCLQGSLSCFEGATTPRNHSPCGVTLDRNKPVLSLHPERYYGWISDVGIIVPEVLLVPLFVEGGAPFGTLWVVSGREKEFTRADADTLAKLAWYVGVAVRIAEKEKQRTI